MGRKINELVKGNVKMLHVQIEKYAKEIEEKLIGIRRKLHENPELSLQEHETAKLIVDELHKIEGMEVYSGLCDGTGVMGILKGGQPGKCILLRGDMDALPIQEETDVEYKSKKPNCMHACGHDAHVTWLLGAAMILGKLQKQMPGTVKFLFQPAEEIGYGAVKMRDKDHVLENPTVDMVFGAHVNHDLEIGTMGIAEKYAYGCAAGFQIDIQGVGGHGSCPRLAINPIMVASQICMMLPQIISSRIDETEPRVISVGSIHAGEVGRGNIIPETCTMNGTIRATNYELIKQMEAEIENVIQHCCNLFHASYSFKTRLGCREVKNDKTLVEICKRSGELIMGEGHVVSIE